MKIVVKKCTNCNRL